MKKLTDEELSRVLSQHAVGQLEHLHFVDDTRPYDCGCVAGVALKLSAAEDTPQVAWDISDAIGFASTGERNPWPPDVVYPSDPDDMLRLLEKAGLA